MLSAGFDHTLSISEDLEATAAIYRRLGFTLSPRGRHIGWGTANYCIMFPEDYMELLGIVDPSQPLNGFDELLAARGAGLLGVAFATHNANQVFAGLDQYQLAADHAALTRIMEHGDGDRELSFRLTHAKAEATPGLNCFWCEHLSRDQMYEMAWLDHPNGAIGVEGITVLNRNPPALEAAYRQLLGALGLPDEGVLAGRGRLDVPVGDECWLRLLSPRRARRRYRSVDPKWTERLGPLGVTILVRDLEVTERYLVDQGVTLIPERGLRLVVDPAEADGAVIEFALD
ncbi:MAG: VOC family protein [Pseudomonadota bacterium]